MRVRICTTSSWAEIEEFERCGFVLLFSDSSVAGSGSLGDVTTMGEGVCMVEPRVLPSSLPSECESEFESESESEPEFASNYKSRGEIDHLRPHTTQPQPHPQPQPPKEQDFPNLRMPGSFDDFSDSEDSSSPTTTENSDTESNIQNDKRTERGRKRERSRIPLGTEISNMTIVTEKGRRWRVREMDLCLEGRDGNGNGEVKGQGKGKGKGRFAGSRCGWGWSWR